MQKIMTPVNRRVWAIFILFSLLFGLLTGLFSGSLQFKKAIGADVSFEDFRVHMRQRIPALMLRYRVPGCSIAIVKNSEILWTGAFGYADVASGRRLTADTPMSVQSITKPFTAWGIMRLVEQGILDLDAPIARYLNSWDFPQGKWGEGVTIRRLLSHTAGMPLGDFTDTYAPGENMPSLREKLSQEAVMVQEPGSEFSYSNVGYHLLELLIEDVTGQKFADYMHSEVFSPLGMKTAAFDAGSALTPCPPTGYNLKGRPVPVYVYPEKASGGLFATAADIGRFAAASAIKNPVLGFESVELMYEPVTSKIGIYGLVFAGYGLGHYIETLGNGLDSVSHGGQGNGIMTHLQIVPETGDALVILTNSQRSWPLIAHILRDWAQWRGFRSVGMTRIIWGQWGLCGLIGLLISASLLIIIKLVSSSQGQDRWGCRVTKLGIAILLLGSVIWGACQKYLFLSSVFPVLSVWLAGAILQFAIILLIQTVFPLSRQNRRGALYDRRKL